MFDRQEHATSQFARKRPALLWLKRTGARLRQTVDAVRVFSDFPVVLANRLGMASAPEPRVVRLRNGIRYKVRPGQRGAFDLHVIREAWLQGLHDRLLATLTGPQAVVIDIGAHIGAFALKAASLAPSARVLCFEPDPDNQQFLQENIRLNRLERQVHAFPLALWCAPGPNVLYLSQSSSANSTFFRNHFEQYNDACAGQTSVPCTTLAEVFDTNGLSSCELMKLDCEGAEYEILYNAPANYLQRIQALAIECHRIPGQSPDHLRAFLEQAGFTVSSPIPERADVIHAVRAGLAV